MAAMIAGSLGKALSRRSCASKWLSGSVPLLPSGCASTYAMTSSFHQHDASSAGSQAHQPEHARNNWGSPGWHEDRRSFSSSGLSVSGALGKVSAVTGSASKAVQDARASVREARERVKAAQRKAYLWIPGPVRQVVEAGGAERQKVMGLHFDAFWQSYGAGVTMAAGGIGTLTLWKLILGTSGLLGIEMGGTAQALTLGASGALSYGALQYARSLNTIDPEAVYIQAMRQLNSHIGVLEAMGAPLVGTEMRAYIVSGGGLRLKGLVPTPRAQRLHMVFLLRGSDARGMVAIEAKRRKGSTSFKLLALDIPSDSGRSARIFLSGQPSDLVPGGLFDELSAPLRTAGTMKASRDAEDDAEDLEIASMRRDVLRPKALVDGGGMYPWERLLERLHDLRRRLPAPLGPARH